MVFYRVRAPAGRRAGFRRQRAGRPRLCRRGERISGRDVEPRGNGVRAVRPEISKIRPPGRGGVDAGGGGIQAGETPARHRAAQDAQSRSRESRRPIRLLDWRSAVSKRGFFRGGGNICFVDARFPRIIAAAQGGGGGGGVAGTDQRVAAGGVVAGGNERRVSARGTNGPGE